MLTPISPQDPQSHSTEIVQDNIDALKALFPEAFTEGRIDFEVLKQLLGGQVDDRDEKYGLNWNGKRRARQIALTPSMGTLRPCPEDSVDWDTTQNIFIEGDNLEVLKLLQKSYAGRVKMIYIDPPYNTGNEFVYPDNFQNNIQNYLELTGQVDGGGRKLSSNNETSGRFHTDWLNMMFPRLKLARNLLQEDGVIFVSIADHEIQNLRTIMDDIFGVENFVATIIWQKVFSPKNTARHFSEDHDYIVVFAKNAEAWTPNLLARTEEMEARYSNPDNDPRGPWLSDNLTARNYYRDGIYEIECPGGRVIEGPPAGRYWVVAKKKFIELDKDNRVWWGAAGNNVPRLKRFISEVQAGKVPQTLWKHDEVGHNQESKKELIELLPLVASESVFETPKPTRLIRRMLELATNSNSSDLVLDFFGGSGTTGHSLIVKNADDSGNRRYICVQLQVPLEEPAVLTDGVSLGTIAEITKERLRRAGKKVKADNPMFAGDTGFRVFKLDSSNLKTWDPDRAHIAQNLLDAADNLKEGRSEQDVLYEVLLKLGLDLCMPIQTRVIADCTVSCIGAGALFVCLAWGIDREKALALGLGLVDWHKELKPVVQSSFVFRDSGFVNDVAKTNLVTTIEQALENEVLSIRSI